ncbi:hypothetical protein AN908_07355 [Mycobacteroides immunogenum]|uniref:Uncharacterized protein n=1 Tax=Mycobacteroides immunogenum TaxID=83262 RepID=A0A7V8LRI7_9MYCO|nr:hypothetical protein AN908_06875 [Mycobacteroides immunogenum]KPG14361.1 hypothetical protein AN908_07355 [Mycobacteroides immunogenum]
MLLMRWMTIETHFRSISYVCTQTGRLFVGGEANGTGFIRQEKRRQWCHLSLMFGVGQLRTRGMTNVSVF